MVKMKKIFLVLVTLVVFGCSSNFYREVDGTSTILGVSLPDEQYIQINALSYLGGSKTIVKEPACIMHEYTSASTNSYFGIVKTQETRTSKITVCPTTNSWPNAQGELKDDPSRK